MNQSVTYQQPIGVTARDRAHTSFTQTMAYVTATAALFALGAYLGRHLTGGVGIIAFIASFACLIGMRFAARTSLQLTVGLLGAFGLLTGLALAPIIAYYASAPPGTCTKISTMPNTMSASSAQELARAIAVRSYRVA